MKLRELIKELQSAEEDFGPGPEPEVYFIHSGHERTYEIDHLFLTYWQVMYEPERGVVLMYDKKRERRT